MDEFRPVTLDAGVHKLLSVNDVLGIGHLHLGAGAAGVGLASIKIDPGEVLAAPESGAIESDGSHLYWTDALGARHALDPGGVLTSIADGTAGAPSISFASDTGTGIYHSGVSGPTTSIHMSLGTTRRFTLSPDPLYSAWTVADFRSANEASPALVGSANSDATYFLQFFGGGTGLDPAVLWANGTHLRFGLGAFGAESFTELVRITTPGGNLCVGVTSAGTSGAQTLALTNTATSPSDSVDMAHLYALDAAGAGTAALALWQEYAPYAGVGVASTHKVPVVVNGTTLYLLATTVQ